MNSNLTSRTDANIQGSVPVGRSKEKTIEERNAVRQWISAGAHVTLRAMEKSATLGKSVAKAIAGALIGAVVGYGVIHLTGFGGAALFAFFGSLIGAGIAFGLPGPEFDPLEGLEESSRRELDRWREEDDDRTAGRGIYVEDDV